MNINTISPEDDPRNPSYNYKNIIMDTVENTDLFNSYIKSNSLKQDFKGMIWGEGPCYIPHKKMLVWSDIPNNRMLKLIDGTVSDFLNPSNFSNGNTSDNNSNLISCSHGGRCVYKIDDDLNIVTLVSEYNGKKLNSPNDVCVKSDNCSNKSSKTKRY